MAWMNAHTLTAFRALVRKDLWLWASNRRSVILGVLAPVLIAAFFGYLFDSRRGDGPSRIPVALTDLDGSSLSRQVVAGLQGDPALDLQPMAEADATQAVTQGRVRAAIVLPAGFGRQAPAALFSSQARPVVTVRYDPSQAMVLPMVRGLLAQQVMGPVFQGLGGGPAASLRLPFDTQALAATGKLGQDYNSYAHSFAGMGVQFILLTGIDFGIALLLTRRMGLWQRLRAAPVSPALLLGSRLASAALIAFGLLLTIFAAGALLFGVRIQGSVLGFVGVALAFAAMTASFGLLIASLGGTPEATRGLAVLVTLLMVMLGGAWAPTFIFPPWLQTLSLATPTRWAVDALDAVTWRAQGLAQVAPQIGLLLACSVVFTVLALWRFERGTSGP